MNEIVAKSWVQKWLAAQEAQPVLPNHPLSSVVPLFTVSRYSSPMAVGTGVLVKVNEATLLLTARHLVRDHVATTLWSGDEGRFFGIGGQLTSVPSLQLNDGTDIDVDVSVIRLEAEAAAGFVTHRPIALSQCEFSDKGDASGTRFAFGYPLSMQSRRPINSEVKASTYGIYTTEAAPDTAGSLGCDPRFHLVVGFDKGDVYGKSGAKQAPNPVGMSGGGLWSGSDINLLTSGQPRLSAILTTWMPRHNAMVATRISTCMLVVGERWPDLEPTIAEAMG